MPTFRVRSNNLKNPPITIVTTDEATARRRAMLEFYGPPQPFGRVAWPIDHKPLNPYAVSPQEWTGAGLLVDEIDKKGQ